MWRKDIILFNNNLNSAEELKESYLLFLRFNALNKSTVTETYTVSDCDFFNEHSSTTEILWLG